MAAEAEAAREARAKVIAAEGEQRASRALKEAADVINESPAALQVRHAFQRWGTSVSFAHHFLVLRALLLVIDSRKTLDECLSTCTKFFFF